MHLACLRAALTTELCQLISRSKKFQECCPLIRIKENSRKLTVSLTVSAPDVDSPVSLVPRTLCSPVLKKFIL